jgi:hypothetical protein
VSENCIVLGVSLQGSLAYLYILHPFLFTCHRLVPVTSKKERMKYVLRLKR